MILVILCAACGVGKTTVKDALERLRLTDFYCADTDQLGLSWRDYEGTERAPSFHDDCLAEAVRRAGERHLLFASCMNPIDFYQRVTLPEAVTAAYCIGMTCSPEEIRRRLLLRPAHWGCGSEAFIASQIDYNGWFRRNAGKFPLFIDNSAESPEETAERVASFLRRVSAS